MADNSKVKLGAKDALIVVDVQNDFCPGGRLAVQKGDEVVPAVNALAQRFANVVLTQDWHPPGHQSFATSHPGRKPFDSIKLPYGEQVLWPDHCVQGSDGAALHKDLSVPQAQLLIRKGYNKDVDSYSAFLEADRRTRTGLEGYLEDRRLSRGARHQARVRVRPGDRFLRGLDRARCAQARLRRGGHRRRLPRDRQPGLARRGLGEDHKGGRHAPPVRRFRMNAPGF